MMFHETEVIPKDEALGANVAADPVRPPRWALLVLSVLLFATYLGVQLVIALAVVLWMIANKQPVNAETLIESEMFAWVSLVAAGVGAAATIGLALIWPRLWQRLASADPGGAAGWLGWRQTVCLPVWMIPLLTIPVMFAVVAGVTQLFGEAEVNIQMLLFSNRNLQIVTSIIVSTVVPLAEELIFRGAMYEALLPAQRGGTPEWLRQLLPLIVTSLAFALVHLMAGFEMIAAIAQILILSFYLGGLRAITGSVKAGVAAHVTWNLISAVAMSVASNLNL